MTRPITDLNEESNRTSEFGKRLWEKAEKNKEVEKITEQEVFHLSQGEAEKCRFEITDQTNRMAECVIHSGNFSHGLRLHPPHLYDIKEGRVYFLENGKWKRWIAKIKDNLTR